MVDQYISTLWGSRRSSDLIQKVIIKVSCLRAGQVQSYGGLEIHSWFFQWISTIEPRISEKLHNLENKPFSMGSLQGGIKKRGETNIEEGADCSFTVSGLNENMCVLLRMIEENLVDNIIQLGTAEFRVKKVLPIMGPDGLSYQDILDNAWDTESFTLEFWSPTSFHHQGKQVLFPYPELVLQSLKRKWDSFSNVALPEIDYSNVQVSSYNLETRLVDFQKYKITGFIGRCTFVLDKGFTESNKRVINALGYYASIAGVGYKTYMALGNCRYYV